MNKKKIVLISFIIFLIFILFHNNVFALSDIIDGMDPSKATDATAGDSLLDTMSSAFTVLQFAGTGISIIAVMKLGISYMFSSIEEKAEIKKKAAPILIGSFLIVATVNILKFVQVFVRDAF